MPNFIIRHANKSLNNNLCNSFSKFFQTVLQRLFDTNILCFYNNLSFLMADIQAKVTYLFMLLLVFAFLGYYVTELLQTDHQIPLLVTTVARIILVQAVAFIPAFIFNTEKFYDLTGSSTVVSITAIVTFSNPSLNLNQIIAALFLGIWAARLGLFLFLRILRDNGDSRFDSIKASPIRFFFAWLLQGLWLSITTSPLLIVITSYGATAKTNLQILEIVGIIVWILGFVIEVVADTQKNTFRSVKSNKGSFIKTGLWKYSRHPNYVGEFLIWIGAGVFAIPSLSGYQFLSLLSPVFEYVLITKISGVSILQKTADEKWGKLPEYQEYKKNTPELFPWGSGDEVKEVKTQ